MKIAAYFNVNGIKVSEPKPDGGPNKKEVDFVLMPLETLSRLDAYFKLYPLPDFNKLGITDEQAGIFKQRP